jgi:hypothetical protein
VTRDRRGPARRSRPRCIDVHALPARAADAPRIIFVAGAGDGTWLLVLFTVPNTASDLALDAIDRRLAEKNVARTGGMHDITGP